MRLHIVDSGFCDYNPYSWMFIYNMQLRKQCHAVLEAIWIMGLAQGPNGESLCRPQDFNQWSSDYDPNLPSRSTLRMLSGSMKLHQYRLWILTLLFISELYVSSTRLPFRACKAVMGVRSRGWRSLHCARDRASVPTCPLARPPQGVLIGSIHPQQVLPFSE